MNDEPRRRHRLSDNWGVATDDLFGPDVGRWLRRGLVAVAVYSAGIWFLLYLLSTDPQWPVVVAAVLAFGLLWRLLPSTVPVGVPTASAPWNIARGPGGSGIFATVGVTWWETRLDWLDGDTSAFVARIQPRLINLVDSRLRLRHGIDRYSDPERAREIIGEPLWRFLEDRIGTAPTPRALSAIVGEIEHL